MGEEKLQVEHCSLENQLADMLAKPLKIGRFRELRDKLSMMSLASMN